MFKLSQSPSFKWPVTLSLAVDGGKYEKHVFDAEFKRVPESRIREFEANYPGDKELLKEIMLGWDGVTGDDGKPVPFSVAAFDQMLNITSVPAQIVQAFTEAMNGAARRKN